MKVTILGSGSAYGLPMIFNVWGKASPDNPKNYRTRASIIIEEADKSILIDAGPELRQQINANDIKNIDSVFITHCHYDHIAGIPELPRATNILGHGINIYAAVGTMNELKKCYGYLFNDVPDAEPDTKSLSWHLLPDSGTFTASGLSFETLTFKHHHILSSAFRYKDFAYVTDWESIPENADKFFSHLKWLIIECNNGLDIEQNGHSNIANIKEIIAKYHPQNIILSHLSRRIDYDDFKSNLPPNCTLAYDGMVLNI